LLKLLEGREVFVPLNLTQHWNKHDFVQVDTRDILFICAGTFSDLHDYGSEEKHVVGFGAAEQARLSALKKRITLKQLIDFGMMAEFMGRLPVVVQLELLGEPELLRVLTEPPDAVTREFQELLALDDIELKFTKDGLREVVHYSMERGLGARGLRSILEHVMSEVMFDAPERRSRTITVDQGFVQKRLKTLHTVGA
jgi:ATP-dependent Clp protease ATP-binding subunit ClpX